MHMMEGPQAERRQCPRTDVDTAIVVRPIGGFNHQVQLHDVSVQGCRVEVVEEVQLGEPLITRLPQLEPLVGNVRWKLGALAGLQFSRNIHPAVLDALVARISQPIQPH